MKVEYEAGEQTPEVSEWSRIVPRSPSATPEIRSQRFRVSYAPHRPPVSSVSSVRIAALPRVFSRRRLMESTMMGPRSPSNVSAQQTHIELMPVVSQDRVHANHRGHYAQRFRDFKILSPAHSPDLYAAVQGRVGRGLPTTWQFHRSIGRTARDERQCTTPLAQRA